MTDAIIFDRDGLHDLLESTDGPVARFLAQVGQRVVNQAKANLSHPGTGRVYRRLRNTQRVNRLRGQALLGGVGRGESMVLESDYITHQASAPGEPPAVDLGALRASVVAQLGRDELGLFVQAGTPLAYGGWLELGTRHIEPRPWLRPAVTTVGVQLR